MKGFMVPTMNPLSWSYVRLSHLAMRQHRPERLNGSGNNEGVHGSKHEPRELAVYGASKFASVLSWCFVGAERMLDFLATMKVFITVFMNPFVHRGRHGTSGDPELGPNGRRALVGAEPLERRAGPRHCEGQQSPPRRHRPFIGGGVPVVRPSAGLWRSGMGRHQFPTGTSP
jgi:hypothetical protein